MSVFSVPVTIGVDEEAISKQVAKDAEDKAIELIVNEAKRIIFDKRGYYGLTSNEPLREIVKDEVTKVVRQREEDIVKMAAEVLADKLSRQKAVKEIAVETAKKTIS